MVKLGEIFNVFPNFAQEGAADGKIAQRERAWQEYLPAKRWYLYGKFVNRFGKRQTIYAKTLNELRLKLREEQYKDEKEINVVTKEVTLDEWYKVWMDTCKQGCRDFTKGTYATHYKRIQPDLGGRKLTSLNLIVMQDAINKLRSDNARKNSKKILVNMLEKAIDNDLLTKNVAKQIITAVSKEEKKERLVLTIGETEILLKQAEGAFYYNLFVLALETGMRIGELCALQWNDIDFKRKIWCLLLETINRRSNFWYKNVWDLL